MSSSQSAQVSGPASKHVRAIVVGAGFGGLYAAYRLEKSGISVQGFESAPDIGGVWYHNRYPGARVDVQSLDYTYYFSPEVYRSWKWSERYASQPALLAYMDFVANKFSLRDRFRFKTTVVGARWQPEDCRWIVRTEPEGEYSCDFLIMATGNLSDARKPDFPGLNEFEREWVMTSRWPEREVTLAGRRIAVIGTGSSGVQAIPVLAEQASQLYVFQRTPNYSVPARNGPLDEVAYRERCADVEGMRARLMNSQGGMLPVPGLEPRPAAECTPAEQQAMLEAHWAYGSQNIKRVFTDQNINMASNDIVAEFVRSKIREAVTSPELAELLCPYDHPIGSRWTQTIMRRSIATTCTWSTCGPSPSNALRRRA
jgi:cation diffusion facilitator CzcD-associated flavoprotein CzcO